MGTNKNSELNKTFLELKEILNNNVKTHSFGIRASKFVADIEYSHDTFFRTPLNEINKKLIEIKPF